MRRVRLALAAAALAMAGCSSSTETAAPGTTAAPTTTTTAPLPTTTSTIPPPKKVLLVGDGVAFDLAPALDAALGSSGRFVVEDHPWFAFGLTKTDVFDWHTQWPSIVAQTKADVVVAFVGPWDVRTAKAAGPAAAAWTASYRAQADAAMATLSAGGAQVLWLGPTPLKAPGSLPRVAAVADVLHAAVDAGGGTFVDARSALGATYSRTGKLLDGTAVTLYKPDGEHLCPDGAARLAGAVAHALGSTVPMSVWEIGPWRTDARYDNPRGGCPASARVG